MQVREQIAILMGTDRLRIYKGDKEVFTGYAGAITKYEEIGISGYEEVKRLRAVPEVRHKNWKALGLMQPMQPEETPDYSFSDLQLTLYYDIYI